MLGLSSRVALAVLAAHVLLRTVFGSNAVVFGYLPTWQLDKTDGVDISRYTHITIAFAVPDENGKLSMDNRDGVLREWVKKLSDSNIKVLVSLGGWTGSKHLSPIMKDKAKRTLMVDDMVSWMRDYSLDGWDIDFEYPGRQGNTCHAFSPSDTANFMEFLRELRQQLGAEFSGPKLVTLATRFQPFDGAEGTPLADVSEFAELVDYFNPMLYDFNGVWSETTGPNAPLDHEAGRGLQFSFKSSIQSWIDAGVPANKINPGIPFYGRTVTVASSKMDNMYQPLLKTIPKGDGEDKEESDSSCGGPRLFSGIWKYRNLRQEGVLDTVDTAKGPWVRRFDNTTYTPWLFNPDTKDFVSYDDQRSIAAKVQYAVSRGLAGVMVWPITNDSDNELLDAITSALA